MKYPEHEKLKKISDKSQACGDFLSWLLGEKELVLAQYHEHNETCRGRDGFKHCGYRKDELAITYVSVDSLLAEFFGIDQQKIWEEKDAMLAEIRASK